MPPFEIPFPASTTIKSPVFDRENTVFPFSQKNKALKRPLIHELILIQAYPWLRCVKLCADPCVRYRASLLPFALLEF